MASAANGGALGAVTGQLSKAFANPPFDKRVYSVPQTGGSFLGSRQTLTRGKLIADVYPGQPRWTLNFLFNPSVVDVAHSVDLGDSGILPQFQRDANDPSQYIVPLNASLSFDLLFDRTYEMWDRTLNASYQGYQGVYVDIATFYGMVGITGQSFNTGAITGQNSDTAFAQGALTGVGAMLPTRAIALFGGLRSLVYYGMIQSGSIEYTHFTRDMIPVRATLSIVMQLIPRQTGASDPLVTAGIIPASPPPQVRR